MDPRLCTDDAVEVRGTRNQPRHRYTPPPFKPVRRPVLPRMHALTRRSAAAHGAAITAEARPSGQERFRLARRRCRRAARAAQTLL